jgi:hypothetical protein
MVGKTQWLTRDNLIGIVFFHGSFKSKNQLAGLITCLMDQSIADDIKAAVATAAKTEEHYLNVKVPEDWLQTPAPTPVLKETAKREERPAPPPPPPRPKRAIEAGEAGTLNVEEGEWPAILSLLKDNSRLNGAIVGLSHEGCSFRTTQPFTGGIQIRVEVDFQVRGLHLLLAGAVVDVRGTRTVDMRFHELSNRKRAELAELIEELRQEAMSQSS